MELSLNNAAIGLALSGGGMRGLAHIGVIKALTECGIHAQFIAGTSAGSLVGAGLAAGMDWQALAEMAQSIFWPRLLHGKSLEKFCERHLPATFQDLGLPFAAIATEFPIKRTVVISQGKLASAISASCALRIIRRPVWREGLKLKDGSYTCVLPVKACLALNAKHVFASDVWELSELLRSVGCSPQHSLFPSHYREAVQQTHCLIQPRIDLRDYWPGKASLYRLIQAGESAAYRALESSPDTFSA